ncbi:MAG: LCP family protein, partial [Actinomycetota bacterium]
MSPFGKRSEISPDRWSGMVRSVRTREHKHLRHRWLWLLAGILVVLGAVAGYAAYLYNSTSQRIQKTIAPVEPPENELEPFTALLVGSDSRKGLTQEEQQDLGAGTVGVTGVNADTLIVAHVVPETDDVTMVQFPRDLWVPIAGGGKGRINSALNEGRSTLVHTVERVTGLEINRYAEVNLAGFKDLIDAIGGVEVCVPEEIPFDSQTGIQVKEPGMVHFSGGRALRFVRSRKVFATGDFARIQNQQRFLAAAIDKMTSVDMLLHLGRVRDLVRVAGENLRVDARTSPIDLLRLARRFQSFDPRHYEAYTAPNLGPGFVGDASVVLPNRPAIRVMFRAIERGRSPAEAVDAPDVAPGTVEVDVLNGTGENKAAARAARALERAT